MALIKTEAIVLKAGNYREKSKILTLYTKSHGKLRVIAKGVRDTKSKWGGVLQSMAYLDVIIYFHENKTLHLLSDAEYADPYQSLLGDYDKMKIGFRIVEMVNKTAMDYQVLSGLFVLLVSSLAALNDATKNFVNLLFYFEFKLAGLLGIAVEPYVTERSGRRKESPAAKLAGNSTREKVNGLNPAALESVQITGKELEILKTIALTDINRITELELSISSMRLIDKFFDSYFREHFESLGYSNTKKVFNSF